MKQALRCYIYSSIVASISLFQTCELHAQFVQLGMDIDGVMGDELGWSVSLSSDGTRVAIAAIGNDGAGMDAGQVRVYDHDGSTWAQVGTGIDGEAANDQFGRSVSLSSDGMRVAIGAIGNDDAGNSAGHVRIYEYDGTNWVQLGMDIDGEAMQDWSGWSVSLSSDGSRVAIGAFFNDGIGPSAGHVRVYDYNGSNWVQAGMDIDGEAATDESGYSVSLSADGSRLAIGARLNDGSASSAGHVRIYDFDGNDWVQVGTDIDGEASGDNSGASVSLSSDGLRLAIGAYLNDGAGNWAGHVRVYEYDGIDWVQLGSDIDGEASGDQSGGSVALSSDGSRLGIGAMFNSGSGPDAGHVRIYDHDGSDWVQVGMDIDGEALNDRSGRSVSLSSDGSRIAIGAASNDGAGGNAGHVRVYEVNMSVGVIPSFNTAPHGTLHIYPNPTIGDKLMLSIPEMPLIPQNTAVSIHNAYGKLVIREKLTNKAELRLSNTLASGVYMVSLTTNERSYFERLVVQRD